MEALRVSMYGVRISYLAAPSAFRNAKWGDTVAMVISRPLLGSIVRYEKVWARYVASQSVQRLSIRHFLAIFYIAISKKLRQRDLSIPLFIITTRRTFRLQQRYSKSG